MPDNVSHPKRNLLTNYPYMFIPRNSNFKTLQLLMKEQFFCKISDRLNLNQY